MSQNLSEFSLFVNEQNDISYLLDNEAVLAAEMMQMVGYLSTNPFKIQFNKPNTTEFMQRALQNGYTIRLKNEEGSEISVASPGNQVDIQEQLDLPIQQQATIMILYKDDGAYYALILNSFAMTIVYFDFIDDDSFNNIQSFIIHNNVKEIIFHADDEQLNRICTEYQVKLVKVSKSLYNEYDHPQFPFEQQFKKCGGCCHSYFSFDFDLFQISKYNSNEFLKLDIYAVRALHVFNDFKDTNSIFGILNKCQTQMGIRLLRNWLLRPLNDLSTIQTRQQIVESFCSANISTLQLNQFPDISRFARKLLMSNITLSELWTLKDVMDQTNTLISSLQYFDQTIQHYFHDQINAILQDSINFYQCIVDNISYEPILHLYKINPHALPSLQQLDDEITNVKNAMDTAFIRIKHSTSDKLTLEKHVKHGYCCRIPKSKASLVKKFKNIIELSSLKAQSFFTTLELQGYSKQLQQLQAQYNMDSKVILSNIQEIGKAYAPQFIQLSELIAQMDVLTSFAKAANEHNYIKPVFGSEMAIIEGRHPCIEFQPDVTFIANDCAMDVTSNVQIITGFNTGGKSTYLRMVGVICLLAHIGSFVPASDCTVPLLDGIFCRVGAGDSLIRGRSTFMNEMLEANSVLQTATKKSLVLIDELGRGTSNTDGFGLAWAILEYLVQDIGSWTFFATHYHELSKMGEIEGKVRCKKVDMTIIDEQIVPCYKIIDGISHDSFGIKVAKMAGFPKELIEMAEGIQREMMLVDK